ncbi:hypothetical protein KY327_00370 [Candidatus Woesearchaeota archaeon]|nr:hypothetical protein [Candidatus Woesearchaeota archaeon]
MSTHRKDKAATITLWALFIAVAAIRIALAFQSQLPDFEAYDQLRHVESIRESGTPLFQDGLGFGGRERLFSPLYHYLLAAFSFILPKIWLVKVVPTILTAAIVFPAYKLGTLLTSKRRLALITALFTGAVPALFFISVNDASPLGPVLALFYTAWYLFLKSRKTGRHLRWLLAAFVILTLLHPFAIVFVVSVALYLVLLQLQRVKTTPKESELLLFFTLFTTWFLLVLFKRAFVAHGAAVIWQNIPSAELNLIFTNITLLEAIASTGLVVLVLGAIALYNGITSVKRKPLLAMTAVITTALILLGFRLAPLRVGLALLSTSLAIAGGHALESMDSYLRKTRAPALANWSLAGLIILFGLATLPTLAGQAMVEPPSQGTADVLEWAKENTGDDAVILASPREGDLIAAVAERRTVIDDNYLLIPRAEERYRDAREVYTSFFKTDAIGLMQRYGATHLLVSPETRAWSGTEQPAYLGDDCFKRVIASTDDQDRTTLLYERTCSLRGEDDA